MQEKPEVLVFLDSLSGVEDTICGVCGSRVQPPNATLYYADRRWEMVLPFCLTCHAGRDFRTYDA
jgi:hypothetical protein